MTDYEKSLSTLTNEELIDEAYEYMNDGYYEDLHRMIIKEMKKRFVKKVKPLDYVETAKNNVKEFHNLVDQLKQQFEREEKK